jgi:hypothetical protein
VNRRLAAVVLMTVTLAPAGASAASYTFTPIASTRDGLTFPLRLPAVNAAGVVAFHAASPAGERILTGAGAALTEIAVTGDLFTDLGLPVIDATGAVAFPAATAGREAVYRGPVPITRDGDGFTAVGGLAALGDGASVVFHATRTDGTAGIFSGSGAAAPAAVAVPGGALADLGLPAAGGTLVTFRAMMPGGGAAIVTVAPGGAPVEIARTSSALADVGDFPAVAADGTVAFRAVLPAGGESVMVARPGAAPVALVTTSATGFAGFGSVAINRAGAVAFLARRPDGRAGIYTGPDPIADRVVEVGGALGGTTVSALEFARDGLGEAGHVAFFAELADDSAGIWRAEPASLRVTALALSPAVGGPGRVVSVTDTTRNRGPAATAAGVTRFYFSADSVLDATDVEIGARAVPALGAETEHTATTSVTIPAGAVTGTYSIIAKAGDTTKSTSYKIGPDLRVANVTGPAEAAAGGALTIGDSTENQGGGPAAASTTRFFLSTDAVLDAADVPLGTRAVAGLAAGAVDTGTLAALLPGATVPGAYFLIARVDDGERVAEIAEGNNVRARALTVTAAAPRPDLVVASLTARPSLAGLTVSDTTQNSGGAAAPATATTYHLSRDAVLDAGDLPLFRRPVRALAAGASSADSIGLALPPGTTGSWYVLARANAEATAAESNETNNTRAAAFTIGADLAVPTVFISSRDVAAGEPLIVIDTVRNHGTISSAPSLTRFFLSSEDDVHRPGVLLGSRAVPALCPRGSDSAPTELTIPAGTPPGRYRIYAVADAGDDNPELREANNLDGSHRFTVR